MHALRRSGCQRQNSVISKPFTRVTQVVERLAGRRQTGLPPCEIDPLANDALKWEELPVVITRRGDTPKGDYSETKDGIRICERPIRIRLHLDDIIACRQPIAYSLYRQGYSVALNIGWQRAEVWLLIAEQISVIPCGIFLRAT